MYFAISATTGPTDPTRAELPFIFAASALQAGDKVMIMLFHDAVHMATKDTSNKIIPFGPPKRFDEVLNHTDSEILVCGPCVDVRHIPSVSLDPRIKIGGMNDFHTAATRDNARVVSF